MMKLEKCFTLLSGFFFAFLISFSCSAGIATAFSLHEAGDGLLHPVDLMQLAAFCAVVSVLMSACHTWRFAALSPVIMLIIFLYFWFDAELKLSVEALCHSVSVRYNNAYGWELLRWSTRDLEVADITVALKMLSVPIAAAVSWTVCRRQELVWALAAAILPIVPCTLITTTVPDGRVLALWLLALGLLFLTQAARKRSTGQGNYLLALFALPVALSVVLLFRFVPQESYDGEHLADSLLHSIQDIFSVSGTGVSGASADDSVDLSDVGNMRQRRVPVMEVLAPTSETYYLRGRSYDVYTGTAWKDSGTEYDLPWNMASAISLGDFLVITRYKEDVRYLPYRSTSAFYQPLEHPGRSFIDNRDKYTQYSYEIFVHNQRSAANADEESLRHFTQLPPDVLQWARDKVEPIVFADGNSLIFSDEIARRICSYVENSAYYSLSTPKMSKDYQDFALWFLEESEKGFCVHFATAATVLLRAAGIPARYVTGYSVDAVAGEEKTVYERDAHAWVEYWEDGYGWRIMDPTPAEQERPSYSATQSSTSETTQPPTTQSPTSTAPTEPTAPSVTKKPSPNTGSTQQTEETTDFTWLWTLFKYLLFVLLPIATLWLQWKLRLLYKRNARRRGTTNERALRAWKEAKAYDRALGKKPDKELRKLAEKARFSQHKLTDEELALFDAFFTSSVTQLRSRPWYRRLFDRVFFALY